MLTIAGGPARERQMRAAQERAVLTELGLVLERITDLVREKAGRNAAAAAAAAAAATAAAARPGYGQPQWLQQQPQRQSAPSAAASAAMQPRPVGSADAAAGLTEL